MALVKKFEKLEKTRYIVHKETESTYSYFIDGDGQRYLQIDTYSNRENKNKGQTSQSIQFDEDAILELLDVIKREFSSEA